ncbi:MAG: UDP-N-acetylmuramyl-tripeptide synthetase [Firmicutes bacterium]|nr:UDP-N-acetylmuramyl-tripeptide synthetase [Bacillota bacterium]
MSRNIKTLFEYLEMLEKEGLLVSDNAASADFSIEIKDLSYNSKRVKEGALFVCKGMNFRKSYLREALDFGAVAYVCEEGSLLADSEPIQKNGRIVPRIVINDMREAMTRLGSIFYDDIWNDKLTMIGITGTKGKSTTATFVKAIMDDYYLSQGEPDIGFLSGIYNYDGAERKSSEKMTTLETLELHDHLARTVENGLKCLVMETSSQAIKYKRTEALHYKVCGFLNVSEDHISDREHPTFEDYFETKLQIFKQSDVACINYEMPEELFSRVREEAEANCQRVLTFGQKEGADYYGYGVESSPDELSFTLSCEGRSEEIKVSIGGYYNASNALAAIAITRALGVPFENIKAGLAHVKVAGRMEIYHMLNKDVDVIVDYAHNRVSYETLFENLGRLYPGRKRLLVFGVHGNKAYNRRQDLGEMAQKYADLVVLTEQDIGTDDLHQIWKDIRDFLHDDKIDSEIENRKEAILHACEIIPDGWIMAICGNGADRFQKRGLVCEPEPTDGEIVQSYIDSHKE